MFATFVTWLNKQLKNGLGEGVIAVNFNLYENAENDTLFDVQVVGCPSFDSQDEDWACHEIFSSGEDLFTFKSDSWESAEEDFDKLLLAYLKSEASLLSDYAHIAFGFVDGDLHIVR